MSELPPVPNIENKPRIPNAPPPQVNQIEKISKEKRQENDLDHIRKYIGGSHSMRCYFFAIFTQES